jgi:hypothetical protein
VSRFDNVPMPLISISTVAPSLIEPTPSDVPHEIKSPGHSVKSRERRLTCSSGEKIMSESG